MPKFAHIDSSGLSDLEYQNHILQGVSRTFALTIPELPPALRDVVGNGYLLCRIADTIEDDAYISIEAKTALAKQFLYICEHNSAECDDFIHDFTSQLSTKTPEAEIDLIRNTQRVICIMRSFPEQQQVILRRCVRTMLEGMIYFQSRVSLAGLDDLGKMNSYCYHVAGVVGEMLTELYCDYSAEIASQRDTLLPLSVSFGQGLQMTNILKDIWTDHQRGMCWLPQDIFKQHNIDLSELPKHAKTKDFSLAMQTLIAIAAAHLHNAMDYTLQIPRQEQGLRLFSLWAIGMAQLSLRKINNNLSFTSSEQVKISRRSVKATVVLTRLASSHNNILRFLFSLLNRSFPQKHQLQFSTHNLPVNKPL